MNAVLAAPARPRITEPDQAARVRRCAQGALRTHCRGPAAKNASGMKHDTPAAGQEKEQAENGDTAPIPLPFNLAGQDIGKRDD